MYHAYALLDKSTDVTPAGLAAKLRERFPKATLQQHAAEIVLSQGDWDYHLAFQCGPEVLTESENVTSRLAGLESDSPLRSCDRRVEVWSDTPDPFMEYFDTHFQILEVLRGFKGVTLIDPKEPALI